jgi:hypothetical protein
MDKTDNRDQKQGKSKQERPRRKESGHKKDQDQWRPPSEPGERSDKEAIGRPVQLDKDIERHA